MGLLVALLEALDNSSGGFARLSGPSAPAWLPELGPWDLYGYLLTAASLACTLLPLVGWGRADGGPLCILLFFWYLRYAGLRFSAGKYKHSRLLLSHKQRRLKAYDVQLPMFRLYLDNPETTPEAECRTVVGVVVEDAAQQEEILLTSSKLTDLISTTFGEELGGSALQDENDHVSKPAGSSSGKAQKRPAVAAARQGVSQGSVWQPPGINFKYLQFSPKSCLSPWFFSRLADSAFCAAGGLRYPRLELVDRHWELLGPGSTATTTVLQPDSSADQLDWAEFGEAVFKSADRGKVPNGYLGSAQDHHLI